MGKGISTGRSLYGDNEECLVDYIIDIEDVEDWLLGKDINHELIKEEDSIEAEMEKVIKLSKEILMEVNKLWKLAPYRNSIVKQDVNKNLETSKEEATCNVDHVVNETLPYE